MEKETHVRIKLDPTADLLLFINLRTTDRAQILFTHSVTQTVGFYAILER